MVEWPDTLKDPPNLNNAASPGGDGMARLADIVAQATLKYSVKDYDAAAELYSQATELQAEVNGEMSPHNADLLYAYGRCLYHLAVEKSDVLGPKIAGEKQDKSIKLPSKKSTEDQRIDALNEQDKKGAVEVSEAVEEKEGPIRSEDEPGKRNKPYFQFTGDENWDTSEEDEDGADQDEDDGVTADDEDDFVTAFEVLDLARVLLLKKLERIENLASKRQSGLQEARQLKERLADTYDLQAEISLEGERFSNAVADLRSALRLKEDLFPQESSILAEAHYKLSLALEFSSITQQEGPSLEAKAGKDTQVDEAMREESAKEMEAAIACCKLRVQKEEAALLNGAQLNGDVEKPRVTEGDIADVRGMVKEMEQRLVELRQPPVSITDPTSMGTLGSSNPLSSVLRSIFGESSSAQKARLDGASKDARDLTNFVKRKRPIEDEILRSTQNYEEGSDGKPTVESAEKSMIMGNSKKPKTSDRDDNQLISFP